MPGPALLTTGHWDPVAWLTLGSHRRRRTPKPLAPGLARALCHPELRPLIDLPFWRSAEVPPIEPTVLCLLPLLVTAEGLSFPRATLTPWPSSVAQRTSGTAPPKATFTAAPALSLWFGASPGKRRILSPCVGNHIKRAQFSSECNELEEQLSGGSLRRTRCRWH